MTTIAIEPMRHHAPGWTSEPNAWLYQVWAPNEKRDYWSAHYQSPFDHEDEDDCGESDFRRAGSLEDVLAIFPTEIASAFREVIHV